MECSASGASLRALARALHCLAKVSQNDCFTLEASPSQLCLRALNATKTAYFTVSFARASFDRFQVKPFPAPSQSRSTQSQGGGRSSAQSIVCSTLIKSALAVFRTSLGSIERLTLCSEGTNASDPEKLRWTVDCSDGLRKTYWTPCVVERDVLAAAIDPAAYPSSIIASPRDLNRLLANFQPTLGEITVIATEALNPSMPGSAPSQEGEPETRAVELRSYVDPSASLSAKAENQLMNTQLWLDPAEEFLEYVHTGDPVDVTFSLREVKAFISFCETSEAEVCLLFDHAGIPVLLVPRFNAAPAVGPTAPAEATLLVATLLSSQLPAAAQGTPQAPGTAAGTGTGAGSRHGGGEGLGPAASAGGSARASAGASRGTTATAAAAAEAEGARVRGREYEERDGFASAARNELGGREEDSAGLQGFPTGAGVRKSGGVPARKGAHPSSRGRGVQGGVEGRGGEEEGGYREAGAGGGSNSRYSAGTPGAGTQAASEALDRLARDGSQLAGRKRPGDPGGGQGPGQWGASLDEGASGAVEGVAEGEGGGAFRTPNARGSEGASVHTRVWSDLSGSGRREGFKSPDGSAARGPTAYDSAQASEDLHLHSRRRDSDQHQEGSVAQPPRKLWRDPNEWIDTTEDEEPLGEDGEGGFHPMDDEEYVPATPQGP